MFRIFFFICVYLGNPEMAYAMGSQDILPDSTDAGIAGSTCSSSTRCGFGSHSGSCTRRIAP